MKSRRVILFTNYKSQKAGSLAGEIAGELGYLGVQAEMYSSEEKLGLGKRAAFYGAISLGGDGTVLSAARFVSPLGISIFPVNLGTFGFIAGIHPDEWRGFLKLWLEGKAPLSRRLMLEIEVQRKGEICFHGCCLNDVVFSARGIAKIINLHLFSGEAGSSEFIKLGSYHSDGLIIATPTGSTAYSAAADGPIVDPELEAMILNPICPFTLIHRPMVMPAGETIMVEVDEEQRSPLLLTIDGQVTEKLQKRDRIYVKKAPYFCLLAASGRVGFYQALRTKLAWSGEVAKDLGAQQ